MNEIQVVLKELILKEGISLHRLSKNLNIDYGSLHRSLHGSDLRWSTVSRILNHLGYRVKIEKESKE